MQYQNNKRPATGALVAIMLIGMMSIGNAGADPEAVSPHDLGAQSITSGACLNDINTGTQGVHLLADTLRFWVDWSLVEQSGFASQDRWQFDVDLFWDSWPVGATSPGDWNPTMITKLDTYQQFDSENGRQQKDYARTSFAVAGTYSATLHLDTIHSYRTTWDSGSYQSGCSDIDSGTVAVQVGGSGDIVVNISS